MSESQLTESVCCESQTMEQRPNAQSDRTEKEIEYEQLKEELKISDNHLAELRLEHVDVCNAYKAMSNQSTPNLFILLRKKLSRIERELQYETNVNQRIKTLLDKASEEITLERLHAAKLRSQHASVACSLDSGIRYKERIAREAKLLARSEAILESHRRQHELKQAATEFRMKKMEADRMDCRVRHKPFWAKTVQDMRLRRLLDEKSSTRERFLRSAASLKAAIDKSKELMVAKNAREKAVADAAHQEEYEQALMEDDFSEDLDTALLLRQRVAQINARHKAFHEAQSRRRLEIVARILDEEQNWRQNLFNRVPLHDKRSTGKKQKRTQSEDRYDRRKPRTSDLVGERSAKLSCAEPHLSPECSARAYRKQHSKDGNSVEEGILKANAEDKCSHHQAKHSPINSTVLQEDVDTIVKSFAFQVDAASKRQLFTLDSTSSCCDYITPA